MYLFHKNPSNSELLFVYWTILYLIYMLEITFLMPVCLVCAAELDSL